MSHPGIPGSPAEGYVRFNVRWTPGPAPDHPRLAKLDALRTRLWDRGWIGITPEGIGFGNLSIRYPEPARDFVITGTATGAARILGPDGYTCVTAVDAPGNTVACKGPVRASAETMSHAAVYGADRRVACVIHIHAASFWQRALELGWPATSARAEYGTPALAGAVQELVTAAGASAGMIVMAGHQDGLLAFGPGVAAAEAALLAAHARAFG